VNRLISSSGPNGTSSFSYDGDGNRVTQTTPAGTYNYVNDTAVALPVVLNEQGPDGAIDYAYGLGLAPTESSSQAFNYFYNSDGLGSVFNLTDSTGTVQETYSYDAWGNALTASGKVGTQNKFRFTGQALDPASGLYFLRARYYDQTAGRLLTKDPLAGFSRVPVTLNRYTYAANDPVKLVDPSGRFPWLPLAIQGGLDLSIYCTLHYEACGEFSGFVGEILGFGQSGPSSTQLGQALDAAWYLKDPAAQFMNDVGAQFMNDNANQTASCTTRTSSAPSIGPLNQPAVFPMPEGPSIAPGPAVPQP
jgi:RHS repeat-associated protein